MNNRHERQRDAQALANILACVGATLRREAGVAMVVQDDLAVPGLPASSPDLLGRVVQEAVPQQQASGSTGRGVFSSAVVAVVLAAGLFSISTVSAGQIPESVAVRAIYGEAAGEPYAGKLALAGALRNRGTTRGVYGLNSPLLAHPDARAWADCRRAWAASATADASLGATHWGSAQDVAAAGFYRRLTPTVRIGGHTFFK